ncbi:MAG: DoxX protein [Alphaproteobacteria bacterium]|nr:DoxX protein [Alphaproteobacteria bacterium]
MSLFETRPETVACRLTASLALMRISLGAFFLVWAIMKFVVPKTNIAIFNKFYGLNVDAEISMVFGAAEAVLAVLVMIGLWRTWSYGVAVLVHGFSQSASWRETLDPWALYLNDSPKLLFWAGVPVLAALIALWLLRDQDRWSVDGRRPAD